jgi:hypothetical protein
MQRSAKLKERHYKSSPMARALELFAAIYGILTVLVMWIRDPVILRNDPLWVDLLVVPACILAPIGGWWAIYQCIRYERRPLKYIALVVFIPFGFVWYYFERYEMRISRKSLHRGPIKI